MRKSHSYRVIILKMAIKYICSSYTIATNPIQL